MRRASDPLDDAVDRVSTQQIHPPGMMPCASRQDHPRGDQSHGLAQNNHSRLLPPVRPKASAADTCSAQGGARPSQRRAVCVPPSPLKRKTSRVTVSTGIRAAPRTDAVPRRVGKKPPWLQELLPRHSEESHAGHGAHLVIAPPLLGPLAADAFPRDTHRLRQEIVQLDRFTRTSLELLTVLACKRSQDIPGWRG